MSLISCRTHYLNTTILLYNHHIFFYFNERYKSTQSLKVVPSDVIMTKNFTYLFRKCFLIKIILPSILQVNSDSTRATAYVGQSLSLALDTKQQCTLKIPTFFFTVIKVQLHIAKVIKPI